MKISYLSKTIHPNKRFILPFLDNKNFLTKVKFSARMSSSEEEIIGPRKRKIPMVPKDSGKTKQQEIKNMPIRDNIIPVTQSDNSNKRISQKREQKSPGLPRQTKKKDQIDDPEKYAMDVINNMRELYKKDIEAQNNNKPSTYKIDNAESIYFSVIKKEAQEACIKTGILNEIRVWLEPLPDKSLPNPKIKRVLLDLLSNLKLNKNDLLKSGIGKIIHFYSKNSRESKEVRARASELIKKWKILVIREDLEE